MTSERQFDIWGPFTGAALRDNSPLPYAIQRRRARFWRVFFHLAVLCLAAGALFALSH